MLIKTVAIIGCGAAGTTFFRTFVDECIQQKANFINIIIFEQARELGPGQAYQDDHEELLINSPIQNMSANPYDRGEFFNWLKKKRKLSDDQINSPDEPMYTSRKVFGLYLNELFEKTIIKASLYEISARVVYDKVTRIREKYQFIIETSSNKTYLSDSIIICTGHNQPKDTYNLSGLPKFINNPYPIKNLTHQINVHETIGIIGNSLTAVDIAIGLQKTGYLGNLYMFSRNYVIPRVRGIVSLHQPKFLTESAVKKIVEKNGNITIRNILRLFRKEMLEYNLPWKLLIVEDDKTKPFQEILKNHLVTAENSLPWQSIIPSTNNVSEFLWHHLSDEEKLIFLKIFHRTWLNHRSSIPPINARLMLNLADEHRLFMFSGIKDVTYNKRKQKYIVMADCQKKFECTWIINATGPSRYIGPKDTLLHELIQQNLAREHQFGGLDVDFETSSLINKQGKSNFRIRLIGHNTAGVYQYTSSLELISKKSMQVAKNFVTFIKKATQ